MWEETTLLFLPLSLSVGLCAGSLRFCCGGWAVESITRWELFPDGRLRVGTLRQICCCFLSFLLCLLVAKHYKIKPPLSLSLSFFVSSLPFFLSVFFPFRPSFVSLFFLFPRPASQVHEKTFNHLVIITCPATNSVIGTRNTTKSTKNRINMVCLKINHIFFQTTRFSNYLKSVSWHQEYLQTLRDKRIFPLIFNP